MFRTLFFFGSKKEQISIGFFLEPKKKVQRGFLAKKMVPPASKTFWEHSAGEHLMVLGKIPKKKCF